MFSAEVGPSTTVAAGPGTRTGLWDTLTLRDAPQADDMTHVVVKVEE